MDLQTGWGFTKVEDRNRLVRLVLEEKPFIVIGSPPCTWWSTIQRLNMGKFSEENKQKRHEEALLHLNCCAKVYKLQMDA